MTTWLDFGASNALAGTVLALFAWLVSRGCGRPQVVFAVWVLVLAKLVTPPLVTLPVESLRGYLTWTPAIASDETPDLPLIALLESDELPSHLQLPSESFVDTASSDLVASQYGQVELYEVDPLDPDFGALESEGIPLGLPDDVKLDDAGHDDVAQPAASPRRTCFWPRGSSVPRSGLPWPRRGSYAFGGC